MQEKYELNEYMIELIPETSETELQSLTEDIRLNGLYVPITIWRDKVIDGRCRQLACLATNTPIRINVVAYDTPIEQIEQMVISLNNRRNLSTTQKAMVAFKIYTTSTGKQTLLGAALKAGVSDMTLKNVLYINRLKPEAIKPLFEGDSVMIRNAQGKEISSNKINTICQYLKRIEEELTVVKNENYNWNPNSQIKTQAGKDWYYETVKRIDEDRTIMLMSMTELANLKFTA